MDRRDYREFCNRNKRRKQREKQMKFQKAHHRNKTYRNNIDTSADMKELGYV